MVGKRRKGKKRGAERSREIVQDMVQCLDFFLNVCVDKTPYLCLDRWGRSSKHQRRCFGHQVPAWVSFYQGTTGQTVSDLSLLHKLSHQVSTAILAPIKDVRKRECRLILAPFSPGIKSLLVENLQPLV